MTYKKFKQTCLRNTLLVAIMVNSIIFAQPIQQTLKTHPNLVGDNLKTIGYLFEKDVKNEKYDNNVGQPQLMTSNTLEAKNELSIPASSSLSVRETPSKITCSNESFVAKKETTHLTGKVNKSYAFIKSLHIGSLDGANDDIHDNYLKLDLSDDPILSTQALEFSYDLHGLKDEKSVSFSVNQSGVIGGQLLEIDSTTKRITTILPSYLFHSGINTILFSRHVDRDYAYTIKNIELKTVDLNASDNQLISVQNLMESENFLKIQGFAAPGVSQLKIADNTVGVDDLVFEAFLARNSTIDELTPFLNQEPGNSIKIDFSEAHRVKDLEIIPSLDLSTQKNEVTIAMKGPDNLVELYWNVKGLNFKEVKPLNQDLINVTQGDFQSYRAIRLKSDSILETRMKIPFDRSKIPSGYGIQDVKTFQFNAAKMQWESVPDAIYDNEGAMVFTLEKDTDYINGVIKVPESPEASSFIPTSISDIEYANPAAGVVSIAPPQANNSGAATTTFPIKLPAARGGFTPSLNLNYSSDGGNGMMGMGWNIAMPAITIDTRWGTPRFDSATESEIYNLNGQQLAYEENSDYEVPQFTNDTHIRTTDRVFYLRKEGSYQRITRRGSNPNNYYWKVEDKSGAVSYYGGFNSPVENTIIRKNGASGPIVHWALYKQEDVNGNVIHYSYLKNDGQNDYVTIEIGDNNQTVTGISFYPQIITYNLSQNGGTESYRVFLEYNEIQKVDASVSYKSGAARIDNYLCNQIKIEDGNQEKIRSYHFSYSLSELRKNLLSSITVKDASNGAFYTNKFEYYNDAHVTSNALTGGTTGNPSHTWQSSSLQRTLGSVTGLSSELTTVSLLGGGTGSGFNAGLRGGVGIGANPTNVTGTIGGGYNYSRNNNKTLLALIDMNGDGLADRLTTNNSDYLSIRSNTGEDFEINNTQLLSSSMPNGFFNNESRTNSTSFEVNVGIGPLGVSKSKGWSKTRSRSYNYLQDFNGDGLIDITKNNRVYFAAPSGENFSPDSDLINFTGGIDRNIIDDFDLPELPHIREEHPQFDHVQVWKAPYTGQIDIVSSANILDFNDCEDTSSRIRFSIEIADASNQFETTRIQSSQSNPTTSTVNLNQSNVVVEAGDLVMFRAHNTQYGCGAKISWDPSISYDGVDNASVVLNIQSFEDENNNLPREYAANDDFYFNDSGTVTPEPSQNTIHASFNLNPNYLSHLASLELTDKIEFVIEQTEFEHENTQANEGLSPTSSTVTEYVVTYDPFTNTLSPSTVVDLTFNHNTPHFVDVEPNDSFGYSYTYDFFVRSSSNVNWKGIQWRPLIGDQAPADKVTSVHYGSYDHNDNNVEARLHLNTNFPDPRYDPAVQNDGDTDFMEIRNDISASNAHIQQKLYDILNGVGNANEKIRISWVTKAYSLNSNGNNPSEVLYRKTMLLTTGACSQTLTGDYCGFALVDVEHPSIVYTDTGNIPDELKKFVISKDEWKRVRDTYDYISSAFYVDNDKIGVNSHIDVSFHLTNNVDHNNVSYNYSTIEIDRPFFSILKEVYGASYRSWGHFLYNGGNSYNYNNEGDRVSFNRDYGLDPIEKVIFKEENSEPPSDSDIDNQTQGAERPLLAGYNLVRDTSISSSDDDLFINEQIINEEETETSAASFATLSFDQNDQKLHAIIGRFGESSVYNVYVNPDDLTSNSSSGNLPAMDLRSISKGESRSGGLDLGPSNSSGTRSFASSKDLMQYVDLNGDRFPDIVTPERILYTTIRGGYESLPVDLGNSFGTGAENRDETYGAGIAGNLPNSTAQNNKGQTDRNPTFTNGNAGFNEGAGSTFNYKTYLDMNGDGLPDQVYILKGNDNTEDRIEVRFNMDKAFSTDPIQFSSLENIGVDLSEISERTSGGISIGAGGTPISTARTTGSFAIGVGINTSNANIKLMLTDVNGDGLPDLVYRSDLSQSSSQFLYRLNTGTGFDGTAHALTGTNIEIDEDFSVSGDIYGSFTYGYVFPVFGIPVKTTLTVSAGLNTSINNKISTFQDINGDGLPDALTRNVVGNEDVITAQLNQTGRTHLLKTAYLPMGGKWEIDYERSGNSVRNPHNKYVLKSVRTHDGFTADQSFKTDETLTLFDYEDGHFDRAERDFLGFASVTTSQVDPQDETNIHAQQVVEYHNENIYSSGLAKTIMTYDAAGELVSKTENTYELRERNNLATTGLDIDAGFDIDYNKSLTAKLIHNRSTVYEGSSSLETVQTYDSFSSFGDVTEYSNLGDTESLGAADDGYKAVISYKTYSGTGPYLPSLPEEIEIRKLSDNSLSRKRTATYTGINLSSVTVQLNDTESLVHNYTYDNYGNMITSSVDNNGTTYTTTIEYDQEYHIYPTRITSPFNEVSEATYDYKFGLPLVITDINNNQIVNQYDDRGRMVKVAAPGDTWTIHMQYEGEAYNQNVMSSGLFNAIKHFDAHTSSTFNNTNKHHALTRHHVPGAHQDQLLAISLVDGLGQAIQVKKTNYHKSSSSYGLNWMIDGKKTHDTFGNVIEQYIPSFKDNYPTDVTNIPFTSSSYDYEAAITTVMNTPATFQYDDRDRVITATLPGNSSSSSTSYSIEDGMMKTTVTNEEGQVSSTFTDVRGRTRRQVVEDLTTWFWYDHLGQKIKVNNNVGYESKFWYDKAGRRIQESHPDRGATHFTYDILGNIIEKRTSNLMAESLNKKIEYAYDLNRLLSITYPDNPANNVTYKYGDANDPTVRNVKGRLAKQTDASGVHYFNYDDLGNLAASVRGVSVPGRRTYWFATQWEYDSFGRMQKIIYPDGEEVDYFYNPGAQLDHIEGTLPQAQPRTLLTDVYYNKIGEKMGHVYGNETEYHVTLDEQRRVSSFNHVFADFETSTGYQFDGISNIAAVGTDLIGGSLRGIGELGGPVTHEYKYDNFNRLKEAKGRYTGTDTEEFYLAQAYTLNMEYDDAHNITRKTQQHTSGIVTTHGLTATMTDERTVPTTSYDLKYEDHAEAAYSITTPLGDVSYVQPHAPRRIVETPDAGTYEPGSPDYRETLLDYDANGNLLSNTLRVNYVDDPDARDGIIQQDTTLVHQYHWDEENRLRAVNLDPEHDGSNAIAVYTYDAGGERVIKHIPTRLDVFQQREASSKNELFTDRIYPSNLVSATALDPVDDGEGGQSLDQLLRYTKHYFMGSTRFSSALGTAPKMGEVEKSEVFIKLQITVDYSLSQNINNTAYAALKNLYSEMDQEHRIPANVLEDDGDPTYHEVGEGISQYWFHADHLGSSSYISDNNGHVTQHMEYLPYGETLVEEHLNSNNTPYKFNGKEQDPETGNYYYGARYYNPKFSFWLSVDPLAEKYFDNSPYSYTLNNPINYIDPDGREVIGATSSDADKVVTDIKDAFAAKKFSKFNSLIKRKNGFLGIGKSRKLEKIDEKSFNDATSGLKGDDLAAAKSVYDAINSDDKMVFEFLSSKSDQLTSAGNKAYANYLVDTLGDFGQRGIQFDGADIQAAGSEGLAVPTKQGVHAFIYDGLGANHMMGKRTLTTFHEGFGHGIGFIRGLMGKANDANTIRYENMIRRVMGISKYRDGTMHGDLSPVSSPQMLPSYR